MTLANTPSSVTVLRLAARKSFSLAVSLRDRHRNALDVTGASFRLVVKKRLPAIGTDDLPELIVDSSAVIVDPVIGSIRFEIQAADLNQRPDEYPFALVMVSEGYSVLLASGVVDLVENAEYQSVADTYTDVPTHLGLQIALADRNVLEVVTGPSLAPNEVLFTSAMEEKLDGIEEGAQVNVDADWMASPGTPGFIDNKPYFGSAAFVDIEDISIPPGGSPGEVLTKIGPLDTDFDWAQPRGGGGGGGALDATGVPAGQVPTANGADSWSWDPLPPTGVTSLNGATGAILLTADELPETPSRVVMTAAERTKLASLTATPSWNDLLDRPTLGTAAAANVTDFLPSSGFSGDKITSGTVNSLRIPRVSALQGFSWGNTPPSGGTDGDIYIQVS